MTTSFGKPLRLASLFDPDTGAPELPSPALIVDLGRFEANVAAAEDWFSGTGKKIRPHVKTHRTPALALRQLTSAAAGLTCATVGEAEAMVQAGASQILIANEIGDSGKLGRIAAQAHRAQVCGAADSPDAVTALAEAACAAHSAVAVLVDVDVGLGRCGVAGPAAATALGAMVQRSAGLRLAGLMGYEGTGRLGDPGPAGVVESPYAPAAAGKHAVHRAGLARRTDSAPRAT